MNIRICIVGIFILPFLLINCQNKKSLSPNIVLVMSDDQGWGDVGYNDHPHLNTPNLDSMAANGLQFNRFYAAAPVCSPTRGSVLTGRHPFRYGITYANVGHLPKEEVALSEILKTEGYRTGFFGKWHLGTMDKIVIESNRGGIASNVNHYSPPWENGYDITFATESKVPTWDPMINPDTSIGGANKLQMPGDSFGTYYWTGPGCIAIENLDGDDSRVIMDRVIPFIKNSVQSQTPFFATVWFHTPHSPVLVGEKYRSIYSNLSKQEQHYYGTLTAMDEQIGRLRQELRRLGVAENTMIWFSSDNGPAAVGGGPGLKAGERQQGITGGFRGRKGTLYEGGIRVPGILEWPAVIPKHRETDFPAVTSDYLPTILDILELDDKKTGTRLDGISLYDQIKQESVNKRKKPIGFQSTFQGKMYQSWIDNRFKLVHVVEDQKWELYDLQNDPFEQQNIYKDNPEKASKLKKALLNWKDSF